MPAAPSTSVIVPIGAVDDLVEMQLRAIAAQDVTEQFEVLLSLNSPSVTQRDALDAAVARLGDDRFIVVDSSDRRGASHARNVGVAKASADRLAFCDADDVVEHDGLRRLLAGLDTFDAVGGHLDERDLVPVRQRSWRPPATPGELPRFQGVPYIVSANMAVRRAAFDAVGGFDEELSRCEDIAISFSLLHRGFTIGYVADAVVKYRHRGGLKALIRQHYLYGKGMTEVLTRLGVPSTSSSAGQPALAQPTGLGLLKANRSRGQQWSVFMVIRRASTLSGRLVGLRAERRRSAAGTST